MQLSERNAALGVQIATLVVASGSEKTSQPIPRKLFRFSAPLPPARWHSPIRPGQQFILTPKPRFARLGAVLLAVEG